MIGPNKGDVCVRDEYLNGDESANALHSEMSARSSSRDEIHGMNHDSRIKKDAASKAYNVWKEAEHKASKQWLEMEHDIKTGRHTDIESFNGKRKNLERLQKEADYIYVNEMKRLHSIQSHAAHEAFHALQEAEGQLFKEFLENQRKTISSVESLSVPQKLDISRYKHDNYLRLEHSAALKKREYQEAQRLADQTFMYIAEKMKSILGEEDEAVHAEPSVFEHISNKEHFLQTRFENDQAQKRLREES